MNKRKYKIGDIINGRNIINYVAGCYIVNCPLCGSTIKANVIDLENHSCRCLFKDKGRNRFSGRQYINSPEKIELIRQKYKNGITDEIMNEFMKDLI